MHQRSDKAPVRLRYVVTQAYKSARISVKRADIGTHDSFRDIESSSRCDLRA